MMALWAATAACSAIYLVLRRRTLSLPAITIHAALLLILLGAAVTHFAGKQGKIILHDKAPALSSFTIEDGTQAPLPFTIALDHASIEYYPGTSAAMDYASEVVISKLNSKRQPIDCKRYRISMNNILQIQGYRFYQTALSSDYSVLSVSYDPYGIGITYGAYALLIISMISFLANRKSRFRVLLRRTLLPVLLLCIATSAHADNSATNAEHPKTIPHALATRLGKVNVYWSDRVMPLQTMARDFCLKVYGSETYMGLSAEQVIAGWLFYYDDWKHRPFIKIGGGEVGRLIGNANQYASLKDFYSARGYKLEHAVTANLSNRNLREVDERVAMVTMVCTGAAFKVYPIPMDKNCSNGKVEWYSFADKPPIEVDDSTYIFMTTCLDHITREVFHRQWKNAADELLRLRHFQQASAPIGAIPSEHLNNIERLYNRIGTTLIPAIYCLLLGFAFILLQKRLHCLLTIGIWLILLWITMLLSMRWIIGGHLPLSNGYETMLLMGWLSILASSVPNILHRPLPIVQAAGLIVAGLSLIVAMMGRTGATVGHLMPVLASPLLSIHVLLVMASYSLLAIITILSLVSICQHTMTDDTIPLDSSSRYDKLTATSAMLLYPAVFLLAAGIFIGAVWANQSWGRYWGWDPKETWALITLLIYALPIHASGFRKFQNSKFLNIYLLLAFISVLMTYFGVNYFLSGMHSYA
jgi:cytochrome c-type biogenesis protein CcsB